MLLFFLITQIFLLSSVTASELSQASIAYNYYSTSDDFLIKTSSLKFSSNRRELFWPYDEAYEEPILDIGFTVDKNDGFLDGDEFNGVRLAPFIAKKFSSDLYLKGGFLYNHVKRKENSNERVESHIGAQLEGKLIKDEKLFLRLEFLEDYLYTQFLFPGGANKFLTAKFITSNILYTHVNEFRWNSQIRQTYYEDNNDSLNIDSEYKFHLGSNGQWLWLGAGFNYITSDRNPVEYWSPRNFFSYSLRAEASGDLTDNLHSGFGLNVGRQKEDESEWGSSIYLNVFLQYGNRNDFHTVLNYEKIESGRDSSKWLSDQYTIQLVSSF